MGNINGGSEVGGIAGIVGDDQDSTSIKNCINAGVVKGNNYVGGIAGRDLKNFTVITNSINTGVIEGISNVGGIVGNE